MHKNDLKNRYVMYIDKNSAWRLGKVKKIVGNTLTVANCLKEKIRINPKTSKILGVLIKNKIKNKSYKDYLESIEWN